jgi:hypothetical protein
MKTPAAFIVYLRPTSDVFEAIETLKEAIHQLPAGSLQRTQVVDTGQALMVRDLDLIFQDPEAGVEWLS